MQHFEKEDSKYIQHMKQSVDRAQQAIRRTDTILDTSMEQRQIMRTNSARHGLRDMENKSC